MPKKHSGSFGRLRFGCFAMEKTNTPSATRKSTLFIILQRVRSLRQVAGASGRCARKPVVRHRETVHRCEVSVARYAERAAIAGEGDAGSLELFAHGAEMFGTRTFDFKVTAGNRGRGHERAGFDAIRYDGVFCAVK